MMFGMGGGGGGPGRPMKCMACDLWSSSYDYWLTHLTSSVHQDKVVDRPGNIHGHELWTEEADCCLKVTEAKGIRLQPLVTYLSKFGTLIDLVQQQNNMISDYLYVKYDSKDAVNKILTSQKKAPHQVQGRQIFFHRKYENSNKGGSESSSIGLLATDYWDNDADESNTALSSLQTIYNDDEQDNLPESVIEKVPETEEQEEEKGSLFGQKMVSNLLSILADKSLEAQLEEFCTQVTLSESNLEDRTKVVQGLHSIIQLRFPKCKMHSFGMDYIGIGNKEDPIIVYADLLDNVLSTEKQAWETDSLQQQVSQSKVFQTLKTEEDNKRFCSDVVKTEDKITFIHLPSKVKVVLKLSGYALVQEANLIKFLCTVDPRVRPLLILLRYWASVNNIFDLSTEQTDEIPGRIITLLAIFHLENRNVIPTLEKLQKDASEKIMLEGIEISFSSDKSKLSPPNAMLLEDKSIMTFSVLSLLLDFLQRFAIANLKENFVSLWLGKFVQKKNMAVKNQNLLPADFAEKIKQGSKGEINLGDQQHYFCVQDLFDMKLNLCLNITLDQVRKFQTTAWKTGEKLDHIINSGNPIIMNIFVECAIDKEIEKQKELEKQVEFQKMHKQVQQEQQRLLQLKKQKEEEERQLRAKREEEEKQQRILKEAEERRRKFQQEEQEQRERHRRMKEEEERKRQNQRDEEQRRRLREEERQEVEKRRRFREEEERQNLMKLDLEARQRRLQRDQEQRLQLERELERNRLISNQEDEQRRFVQRQQEEHRVVKQRELEKQDIDRKKYEDEQKELEMQQWNRKQRGYDDKAFGDPRRNPNSSSWERNPMNRNNAHQQHQADYDNSRRPEQIRRDGFAPDKYQPSSNSSNTIGKKDEEDDWLNTEWEEFSKSLEEPTTAPPSSFMHLIQKKPVAPIAPSRSLNQRQDQKSSFFTPPPSPVALPSHNNFQYGPSTSQTGLAASKGPLRYDNNGGAIGFGSSEKIQSSRRESSEFFETDSSEDSSSSSESENEEDEEEEGPELENQNTRIKNPFEIPKITMCPYVKNLFVEAVESKDFAYGIRGKLQTLFLQFMKEFNNRFWQKCFGFEIELDPTYQDTSPADYAKFGDRKSVKMTDLLNSVPCFEENFISAFFCQNVEKLSVLLTESQSNNLRNSKFIRKQSSPMLKVLMDEMPGSFVRTNQTLRFKVEVSIVLDYSDLNKECRPYIKLVFDKGLSSQNEMLAVFQFFGKLYTKMATKFLGYCYKRWLASCVDFDLKSTEKKCAEQRRSKGNRMTRKERRKNRRLKRAEKKKRQKMENSWAPSSSVASSRGAVSSDQNPSRNNEVYGPGPSRTYPISQTFYERNQQQPLPQMHSFTKPDMFQGDQQAQYSEINQYSHPSRPQPPQQYPPQEFSPRGRFIPGRGKTFPVPPSWNRSLEANNPSNNMAFRRQF